MRMRLLIRGLTVAVGMAATMTSLSASDQVQDRESVTAKQQATQPAAPTQFATLKGIKAVPMKTAELKEVKGQHIHFFVNGEAHPSGRPFLVNHRENNLGGGQAPDGSGPGYSGLCLASALGTSAIFIPPGEGC